MSAHAARRVFNKEPAVQDQPEQQHSVRLKATLVFDTKG